MAQENMLETLRAEARRTTKAGFEETRRGFYLMGKFPARTEFDGGFQTDIVTVESVFSGEVDQEEEEDWQDEEPAPQPFVVALAKKPGNEWLRWISVGRAGNNDVVLRHPSVSKLHARVQTERKSGPDFPDGIEYFLIDAGSSNGTWVNDRLLRPPEPHALKLGDRIRLGDVECDFLDADLLYHRLRRLPTFQPLPDKRF